MKVLHVITGLGNGGAEGAVFRLCIETHKYGVENTVVSLTNEGVFGERLKRAGVNVYCLQMRGAYSSIRAIWKLRSIIDKICPSIVQTWMYHSDFVGGIAARMAGQKNVVWGIRHSNLDRSRNKLTTLGIAKLCAMTSRFIPAKIVSCSKRATKVHAEYGYDPNIFVNIPNGYDLDLLRPDADARLSLRRDLGISPHVMIIGMVARYHPQKDHLNLVKALSILRQRGVPIFCVMAGPGVSSENVALVTELRQFGVSESVTLLGECSNIPRLMASLDMHVLSSLGEAFPNVVAEAMGCGTPCVVTDVGDAANIVDECGWVVRPENADALAKGIVEAFDSWSANNSAWLDREAACRRRVEERYSIEAMATSYMRVWSSVLDDSTP